jgi:nicotinamidase-related amidase
MARSVFPHARTALLIVDVINLFDFPRGAALARRALLPARRIRRLRDRAHARGVPVIYVNDNWGRWRSDFKSIVADCSRTDRPGAPIAELLTPTARDFFVLKPHLSGFHETPLDTLLQGGGVRTVVIVGFAADNCVFFTAVEAHMRDYNVAVPSDCCASEVDEERRHALAKMRKFLDADTSASRHLRLRR